MTTEEMKELDRWLAEIWKPIEKYNGWYEISDSGRIRSWKHKNGKRKKPFILALSNNGRYFQVHLYHNNKHIVESVHRLVLQVFKGSQPSPAHNAAHNNGNSYDNRVENLRWATQGENLADMKRHNTILLGEKSNNSKLTKKDIKQIRKRFWLTRESINSLSNDFKVHITTIHRILRRLTWKHI